MKLVEKPPQTIAEMNPLLASRLNSIELNGLEWLSTRKSSERQVIPSHKLLCCVCRTIRWPEHQDPHFICLCLVACQLLLGVLSFFVWYVMLLFSLKAVDVLQLMTYAFHFLEEGGQGPQGKHYFGTCLEVKGLQWPIPEWQSACCQIRFAPFQGNTNSL